MERNPLDRQVAPCNTNWGSPGGLGQLKPNLSNDDQDIWGLLWFVKVAAINQRDKDVLKNWEDIDQIVYGYAPIYGGWRSRLLKNVSCQFEAL